MIFQKYSLKFVQPVNEICQVKLWMSKLSICGIINKTDISIYYIPFLKLYGYNLHVLDKKIFSVYNYLFPYIWNENHMSV